MRIHTIIISVILIALTAGSLIGLIARPKVPLYVMDYIDVKEYVNTVEGTARMAIYSL